MMEIILGSATSLLTFIVIMILRHIVKKIDIVKRGSIDQDIKIDSLVFAMDKTVNGNSKFVEIYDEHVEALREDYKFKHPK